MRPRLCTAFALAGLATALLVGCGGTGDAPEDQPTTLQPTTAPAEPSSNPAEPTDESTDGAGETPENVQAAIDDLADRLGVPATDIQAGPLEPVTWPNGALGCPAPGQAYPEVLSDGYRLLLTADGDEYAYHAGADGELFYCENPTEPVQGDTETS